MFDRIIDHDSKKPLAARKALATIIGAPTPWHRSMRRIRLLGQEMSTSELSIKTNSLPDRAQGRAGTFGGGSGGG